MNNKLPTEGSIREILKVYARRLLLVAYWCVAPVFFLCVAFLLNYLYSTIDLPVINILLFLSTIVLTSIIAFNYNDLYYKLFYRQVDYSYSNGKAVSVVTLFVVVGLAITSLNYYLDNVSSSYGGSQTSMVIPNISTEEYTFYSQNLDKVLGTYWIWLASNRTAKKIYGESSTDGNSDAFRHCYAAYLLSKRYGVKNTEIILNLHEAFSDNSILQKKMDVFNNNIGIQLYKLDDSLSDNELQVKIKLLIKEMKLMKLIID